MSDKKQLPAGIPPLPEGAVYLGRAPLKGGTFSGWIFSEKYKEMGWTQGINCLGQSWMCHYAAPKGSPIATLNGHSPEIKEEGETPETDKQE